MAVLTHADLLILCSPCLLFLLLLGSLVCMCQPSLYPWFIFTLPSLSSPLIACGLFCHHYHCCCHDVAMTIVACWRRGRTRRGRSRSRRSRRSRWWWWLGVVIVAMMWLQP